MLESHIDMVKKIESKLNTLANMKANGEIDESIYKGIVDVVMQKFNLFNCGIEVLMCLTNEYLKSSDVVPFYIMMPKDAQGSSMHSC